MVDSTLSSLINESNVKSIDENDEIYAVIGGHSRSLSFSKLGEYIQRRVGIYNVKDFGAKGDGLTDDLLFIQSAIDAAHADGGGTVHLPSGVYVISGSLVPKSGVSLKGVRCAPLFTQNCPDLGISMDSGTWLRPSHLGTSNAIEFNTSANSITDTPLSNIEISGIGFFGFNVGIKGGALNSISFGLGRLEDLVFLGKNGPTVHTTHALEIENFQHLQINYVKAFNCLEPFYFKANHQGCSPGNSVFVDLYAYMDEISGNYGLALHTLDGSLQLNAITIIRPQINWFHNGASGKSHISLHGLGSGQVSNCHLLDTNTEGLNGAHIKWVNAFNCSATVATVASDAIIATILLRNTSGTIHSKSPKVTIDCDGPSSSRTVVSGIIKSISSETNPPGMRGEFGSIPRENFTGLSRDGKGLRVVEGSSAVHQENSQIVQQITNIVGSGAFPTLKDSQAGSIYVSLDSATNGKLFLPHITPFRFGLEYTVVRKDSMAGDLLIGVQLNHTISGFKQVVLHAQWDYVTLRATDDGETWLLLGTNGSTIPF